MTLVFCATKGMAAVVPLATGTAEPRSTTPDRTRQVRVRRTRPPRSSVSCRDSTTGSADASRPTDVADERRRLLVFLGTRAPFRSHLGGDHQPDGPRQVATVGRWVAAIVALPGCRARLPHVGLGLTFAAHACQGWTA